jgi:hypothetical protein
MKLKLQNLLDYLRENAISVDGKFVELDIAVYQDELDYLISRSNI